MTAPLILPMRRSLALGAMALTLLLGGGCASPSSTSPTTSSTARQPAAGGSAQQRELARGRQLGIPTYRPDQVGYFAAHYCTASAHSPTCKCQSKQATSRNGNDAGQLGRFLIALHDRPQSVKAELDQINAGCSGAPSLAPAAGSPRPRPTAPPAPPVQTKTCQRGTATLIDGATKCLQPGEFCSPSHQMEYRSAGFTCDADGRLH